MKFSQSVIRNSKCGVLGIFCLLTLTACQAKQYRVEVAAGMYDRHNTPVYVDLFVPEREHIKAAVAVNGKTTQPAQVETLPDQHKLRVWWIAADVAKGTKRGYTIKFVSEKQAEGGTYYWKDTSENNVKSATLMKQDGSSRPVLQYIYTPFDPKDIENTKKPFHQVYDPDGSRIITQGLGGKKFPHHRGIFYGYHYCKLTNGETPDTWHAPKGEHEINDQVLSTIGGPVIGGHTLRILWNDQHGKPFAEEERQIRVYTQPDGQMLIDFLSTLKPTGAAVMLSGDREHAGVQFRASGDVADNEKNTRYLRPLPWAALPTDQEGTSAAKGKPSLVQEFGTPPLKGLPWDALQYSMGDRNYTVAYLSSPQNPKNADFSERLYGRFGEYAPWELRQDHPLVLHYRWWITATRDVSREQLEQKYEDLANPPIVSID